MPALSSDLRRQLENVVIEARDVAEAAATSALKKRAVDAAEPHAHFGDAEKEQRNRLRARGRQVGDVRRENKTQTIDQLAQELAYEFWHRMLFARFLEQNGLLIDPEHDVSVDLEYCEEVAASKGAANGFDLAARYASTMLPQIFRTDDVLLEVEFAPEQRVALEKLLGALPSEMFKADDSLGWCYQFWQSKRKEEANQSGDKIDGRTLPAVTQLFTEHYMVQFLLHNTIGAWWCARHAIKGPAGGAGVPAGRSPVEMEYLRWRDDGTPAAGAFAGWPKTLKEFTLLDPCCGSGHFLVASFNLLVPLRMHDEGLTAQEACDAVLRENIHGLELDPRCTQIAAFALALAAWKYPGPDSQLLGYRKLPTLQIACSGQGVSGKKEEWLNLANGDERLRAGMDTLYDLFQQAPHLGSLINPRFEEGDLFEAGYDELQSLLLKALVKKVGDADLSAVGVAAQGITRAAELLGGCYTLVITNVPYLGRGKQNDVMKEYLDEHYSLGKADLATAFVLRCLELCDDAGCSALVTPQNWLFLTTYTKLREMLLKERTWHAVVRLGSNAFRDMNWWAATTALVTITARSPDSSSEMFGVDVSSDKAQEVKANRLANLEPTAIELVPQASQLKNPDARIVAGPATNLPLLATYAAYGKGSTTGDSPRFILGFWELPHIAPQHVRWLDAPADSSRWGGRSYICKAPLDSDDIASQLGSRIHGQDVWHKPGIALMKMGVKMFYGYDGEVFDDNVGVICPQDVQHLPAIWAFCESGEYTKALRLLDQKVNVTAATLVKVPFDLAHWQTVAAEKYPAGLPKPHSDDPTQWLFKGDIVCSTDPLQVTVARLLGHRWPEQPNETDAVDVLADADGIVCIPAVRAEAAAAERVLDVLRTDYGASWTESTLSTLLTNAGCAAGTTLDEWLRDKFFEQHCKRFQQRPFVWHIWDGRKDGFSALVNYHKLTDKTLESLTYAYLGDWIKAQDSDAKATKTGADLRLKAAQELQAKLKLILAGETPYDIFVRWKPLHEQPIGWHPDLNDGVRMNIRPFVEADVLRKAPSIHWRKDRGKEPKRDKGAYPWFWSGNTFTGDRVNDIHLTNAEKQAARAAKTQK